MTTFVPRLWNCCWTISPADWLTETSRITAATPITMPSTVSAARILFLARARRATRMISQRFMGEFLRRRGRNLVAGLQIATPALRLADVTARRGGTPSSHSP